MDQPLHYDVRDILIAPARALSAKRILVMTLFLTIGMVIFDLLTYVAVALDGEPVGTFWKLYGPFPLRWFTFDSIAAQAAFGTGVALALLSLMTGLFAVSAIEVEQIRGNRFFPATGAIRFALRRLGQIVISELAIVAFLLVIVLLFLLLGLLTRIPVLGEWIYALTFLLPGFIIAIFSVFIFAILQVSVLLLPSTAAAERHGESFTAVLETFSTVIRQPVRWLVYTAYGLVAAKAASWVYAYFCYRAVQFSAWVTGATAGAKAPDLVREGLAHLPVRSDLVEAIVQIFPGVPWSFAVSGWTGRGDSPAGYAMALMLFFIFASILGYLFAAIATAQTRTYVVIRYLKDDHRIGEELPLFYEEEHVNAPSAPGQPGQGEQPDQL